MGKRRLAPCWRGFCTLSAPVDTGASMPDSMIAHAMYCPCLMSHHPLHRLLQGGPQAALLSLTVAGHQQYSKNLQGTVPLHGFLAKQGACLHVTLHDQDVCDGCCARWRAPAGRCTTATTASATSARRCASSARSAPTSTCAWSASVRAPRSGRTATTTPTASWTTSPSRSSTPTGGCAFPPQQPPCGHAVDVRKRKGLGAHACMHTVGKKPTQAASSAPPCSSSGVRSRCRMVSALSQSPSDHMHGNLP